MGEINTNKTLSIEEEVERSRTRSGLSGSHCKIFGYTYQVYVIASSEWSRDRYLMLDIHEIGGEPPQPLGLDGKPYTYESSSLRIINLGKVSGYTPGVKYTKGIYADLLYFVGDPTPGRLMWSVPKNNIQLPPSIRFKVIKRDGFACSFCGRNPREDGVKLHVDHIIPRIKNGSNNENNLQTLCQDCNLGKGTTLI
jgi:hypothetical protein